MKRALTVLCLMTFLFPCLCLGETWEEFQKAKGSVEKPKLISKGDGKLISKDIIVRKLKENETVEFSSDHLLFEYGKAVLRPESEPQLEVIADSLRDPELQGRHFYVNGHTCHIGSDENNCRLSWARARSVAEFLESRGIDADRLTMRGYGEQYEIEGAPLESSRRVRLSTVVHTQYEPEGSVCTQADEYRVWRERQSAAPKRASEDSAAPSGFRRIDSGSESQSSMSRADNTGSGELHTVTKGLNPKSNKKGLTPKGLTPKGL